VFINLHGFKTQKVIDVLGLLNFTSYCNIISVTFDNRQSKLLGLGCFNFNSTPHCDMRRFRLRRDKYSSLHCNGHCSIARVGLSDVISFIINNMAPAVFVDCCKRVWRHLLPHIQDKCKMKAEYPSEIFLITYQAANWRTRLQLNCILPENFKCECSCFLCRSWTIKWSNSRSKKLQCVIGTALRIAKSN
jgi:hypothetical protein